MTVEGTDTVVLKVVCVRVYRPEGWEEGTLEGTALGRVLTEGKLLGLMEGILLGREDGWLLVEGTLLGMVDGWPEGWLLGIDDGWREG